MTFKQSLRTGLLLLTALAGLQGAPSFAAGNNVESSVPQARFNFLRGSAFEGIGAHTWAGRYNSAAIDTLLSDINARLVRVSMVPKVYGDQYLDHMTVEQLYNLMVANDTAEQRNNFTQYRDRMAKLGVKVHLIVWDMPAPWVTVVNRQVGRHAQSTYAQPEHLADYANYIVAQLIYLRGLGIYPNSIELTNEPHGAWATKFVPEDYATFADTARKVMDAYGFSAVKIDGAGVDIASTAFGDALKAAGDGTGYKTYHMYNTLADLTADLTPIVDPEGTRPTIITEFGVKDNADENIPDLDVNSFDYALDVAAKSLVLLNKGASGLIYWEAADMPFTQVLHGMLDINAARRPVANALKTLFSLVPHDSLTTLGKGSRLPTTMPMQAFVSNGTVYVLAVNTGDTAQAFKTYFRGIALPTTIRGIYSYQDPANKVEAVSVTSMEPGVLNATIAPKTIATIVLE